MLMRPKPKAIDLFCCAGGAGMGLHQAGFDVTGGDKDFTDGKAHGWPMYCRDVKQLCDSLGNPSLPPQSTTEHHAMSDAVWTKQAYDFLTSA